MVARIEFQDKHKLKFYLGQLETKVAKEFNEDIEQEEEEREEEEREEEEEVEGEVEEE